MRCCDDDDDVQLRRFSTMLRAQRERERRPCITLNIYMCIYILHNSRPCAAACCCTEEKYSIDRNGGVVMVVVSGNCGFYSPVFGTRAVNARNHRRAVGNHRLLNAKTLLHLVRTYVYNFNDIMYYSTRYIINRFVDRRVRGRYTAQPIRYAPQRTHSRSVY